MSDAPRLVFPCAYPIKVLGDNSEAFSAAVLAVFTRLLPGETFTSRLRTSSGARFVAVTVTITATGPDQLAALHEALRQLPGLRLVL